MPLWSRSLIWPGFPHDRLLAGVRKQVRRSARSRPGRRVWRWGLTAFNKPEAPVFAQPDGTVRPTRAEPELGTRLNCNGGLGSATFVTGAFGFAAAGWIVQKIAEA